MSTGHKHHRPTQPIDPARQRELETLLANPQFAAAVSAYKLEDCTHDVPYVGGSLTDWRTVCWDRKFCQAVQQGKFLIGGKPEDPRPCGRVHEATEGVIIHLWELCRQLLGWPETTEKYPRGHDIADVAEHHAVLHKGWPWPDYQAGWRPFVRLDERETITDPPRNLLLDAYRGTPLYGRLATFQFKARAKA